MTCFQLQKSVKELRSCGEMYQKLYQSAFDADPESLANIQVNQQMCLLLAQSTEKVCQLGHIEEFSLDIKCVSYFTFLCLGSLFVDTGR